MSKDSRMLSIDLTLLEAVETSLKTVVNQHQMVIPDVTWSVRVMIRYPSPQYMCFHLKSKLIGVGNMRWPQSLERIRIW